MVLILIFSNLILNTFYQEIKTKNVMKCYEILLIKNILTTLNVLFIHLFNQNYIIIIDPKNNGVNALDILFSYMFQSLWIRWYGQLFASKSTATLHDSASQ